MEAPTFDNPFNPGDLVKVRGIPGPLMSVVMVDRVLAQCLWFSIKDGHSTAEVVNVHYLQLERPQ